MAVNDRFAMMQKKQQETATPNGKTVFSLDDGTKEITFVNNYGQVICRVHFRAGDLSIMDRFEELQKTLPQMLEPLTKMDINPDGTTTSDDAWAEMKKVEGVVKQQINKLLDTNEADLLLKNRNPFSSVGGAFYIEKVLDALGQAISASVKEEAALFEERTKKYVDDIDEAGGVSTDAGSSANND